MITRDLRGAIARAAADAGFGPAADPGLRPAGAPGRYAASVALALGANPRDTAATLRRALVRERWIDAADVTGPGYLTVTVAPWALAAVAGNVSAAGPGCVTSDALAGTTVTAAATDDPLAAATWEAARAALAARLTARLAAAAGATVTGSPAAERNRLARSAHAPSPVPARAASAEDSTAGLGSAQFTTSEETGVSRLRSDHRSTEPGAGPRRPVTEAAALTGGYDEWSPRAAVAFAGRDAVLFTLARAIPGRPVRAEGKIMARHVLGNPAYAVRYAHARAASGVRWAAASRSAGKPGDEAVPPHPAAGPGGTSPRAAAQGELALLDALSWLPERVATAARRGRPDEFARYLEDLASATVDVLSTASHPGRGTAPGSDRLALAGAARAGLAAGLGLLGVTAPDRL